MFLCCFVRDHHRQQQKKFSVQKTEGQWRNWSKKCPRHGFVALGDEKISRKDPLIIVDTEKHSIQFEETFLFCKNGQLIILMSMTDRVQIQSQL